MNQFLSTIEQHLRTGAATLVVIFTINLAQAVAQPLVPHSEAKAQSLIVLPASTQIVQVSYRPDRPKTNPVLLRASPAQAFIFSTPNTLLQAQVEAGDGSICKYFHPQTADETGTLALSLAATRNCPSPKLVILH